MGSFVFILCQVTYLMPAISQVSLQHQVANILVCADTKLSAGLLLVVNGNRSCRNHVPDKITKQNKKKKVSGVPRTQNYFCTTEHFQGLVRQHCEKVLSKRIFKHAIWEIKCLLLLQVGLTIKNPKSPRFRVARDGTTFYRRGLYNEFWNHGFIQISGWLGYSGSTALTVPCHFESA